MPSIEATTAVLFKKAEKSDVKPVKRSIEARRFCEKTKCVIHSTTAVRSMTPEMMISSTSTASDGLTKLCSIAFVSIRPAK